LFCAVAAACGGNGQSPQTAEYVAAAPTFDKMALSQNDTDENEAAVAAVAAQTNSTMLEAQDTGDDACHPHLFINTRNVIGLVNGHFFKLLHHVEEVIKKNPQLDQGGTKTWEDVRDGIDRKFTMTGVVNADQSVTFDFELDLAVASPSTGSADAGTSQTFVKVLTGSLTHIGPSTGTVGEASDAGAAPQVVENKGSVTFDFDALHSVMPRENAQGQLTDTFDDLNDPAKGIKRTATVTLTNFTWDNWQFKAHGVRNGSYTWVREPGVGGYFQYSDSFVLQCPSNPNQAVADVLAVARWYKAADGSVHGRSDAQATGGQIAAGTKWEGMTCATGRDSASVPDEGEWMMKAENAEGTSSYFALRQTGLTPCDPVFGNVPDQNDATNDYNFSSAVTFPNEW
jgi:hypothetical protein